MMVMADFRAAQAAKASTATGASAKGQSSMIGVEQEKVEW